LNNHAISDEVRYRLLTHLAEHPDTTQRELADALEVSLGKAHYCLNALMRRGLVKMRNFRKSPNKGAYVYVLTPKGIEEKVNVTYDFLRRKMAEYDDLKLVIERLSAEVHELDARRQEVKR
jgi:MarR family transcriptional regulator, temperature-dependent positive regulator of motility